MKRGQVTIFIILGIVIVAAVAFAVLYFTGKTPSIVKTSTSDPNMFLTTCLQDSIKQSINQTAFTGGDGALTTSFHLPGTVNPTQISYLCYTNNNSGGMCSNLYMLFPYFEDSMHSNLESDVQACYNSLITNLGNQNDILENNYHNFTVNVEQTRVVLEINADISTRKKNSDTGSQRYHSFKVEVSSQVYGLLQTVNDVLNNVAMTCILDSRLLGNYAGYNINSHATANQSTIYTVNDINTGEQFNFATRTCVVPQI